MTKGGTQNKWKKGLELNKYKNKGRGVEILSE